MGKGTVKADSATVLEGWWYTKSSWFQNSMACKDFMKPVTSSWTLMPSGNTGILRIKKTFPPSCVTNLDEET